MARVDSLPERAKELLRLDRNREGIQLSMINRVTGLSEKELLLLSFHFKRTQNFL